MQIAPPVAPAAPLGQTCSPRPPVGVSVVPDGAGHLQVAITATTNASTPTNQLHQVRLTSVTNAQVYAGLFAQRVPFTLTLPPGIASTPLAVHQLTRG